MKYMTISILMLLMTAMASAIPANPEPFTLTQPDGTSFCAKQIGDEYNSHYETINGHEIFLSKDNYWRYKINNTKLGFSSCITYRDTSPANPESTIIDKNNELHQYLTSIPTPQFPPGHNLYKLKLVYEGLQETFTFNKIKLIRLKQEHMQNRIDELRYEVVFKNGNHAEELIEKIKVKEKEIDEIADRHLQCVDGMSERGSECYMRYQEGEIILDFRSDDFKITIKNSQEVLTNLLNDPRMPNTSRRGLENALNNTMKMKVSANMVQGDYQTNYASSIPFKSTLVYDSKKNEWNSIIVVNDKIHIRNYFIDNIGYDYVLYPTETQLREVETTIKKINKDGLGYKEKYELIKLWYQIKKEKVN